MSEIDTHKMFRGTVRCSFRPPTFPPPSPFLRSSLSLSIHLPSPFPILSVSSTREGRIADVFTIVVSLDRKVRHGCRYRTCALFLFYLLSS